MDLFSVALTQVLDRFSPVFFGLLALGTADAFIDFVVFQFWFDSVAHPGRRFPLVPLKVLFVAQVIFHFVFLTSLMTYALGFSGGYEEAHRQFEGRVLVQDAVEQHIRLTGSTPRAVSELDATSIELKSALKLLNGENFTVEAEKGRGYRITFAGSDHVLGTADDVVFTQSTKMRPVLEKLKGKR